MHTSSGSYRFLWNTCQCKFIRMEMAMCSRVGRCDLLDYCCWTSHVLYATNSHGLGHVHEYLWIHILWLHDDWVNPRPPTFTSWPLNSYAGTPDPWLQILTSYNWIPLQKVHTQVCTSVFAYFFQNGLSQTRVLASTPLLPHLAIYTHL